MASRPRYLCVAFASRTDDSAHRMRHADAGHAHTAGGASRTFQYPAYHTRRRRRRLSRCEGLGPVPLVRGRKCAGHQGLGDRAEHTRAALSRIAAAACLARQSSQGSSGPTSASAYRSGTAAGISSCATTAPRIRACSMWPMRSNATPRVLVDPNGKREDATIALSQWSPSPDGKLVAYALSDGGTDWNIWHFRRVADGTDLPVTLKFSKFWPVAWARDSSGVYYSRYPVKAGEIAPIRPSAATMPAGRTCISTSSSERAVRRPARLPGDRSPLARTRGAGHRRWALPHHQSVRRLPDQWRAGAGPAQARRKAAAAVRRLGRALQLHRLEGRRAVFPDHACGAARPRDRGESGEAPGHRLAHRRAAGRLRHQQLPPTSAAASWSNTRATRAAW